MNIQKSVFSLAKYNNGYFKSQKQAHFLISQMDSCEGFIGHANSGYNSCPVFAEYDTEGIIKITKHSKNGRILMFERKVDGKLTTIEIKEIKKLKKRLKSREREIIERQESFDDGSYNGSGDTKTYTSDTIRRFKEVQDSKLKAIQNLKSKINNYETRSIRVNR